MTFRSHVCTLLFVAPLLILVASTDPAHAQSPAPTRTSTLVSGWEVDVYGGGLLATQPPPSAVKLPDAGQTFTTIVGGRSRAVSSWYFGDGAAELNQINLAFR